LFFSFTYRYPLALALTPGLALLVSSTQAQTTSPVQDPAVQTAEQPATESITVTGKRPSALGTSVSASAGTVTSAQIADQPTLRPGEILQLVPGLVVVQHAAGGKANQYYLRGFQLDHGDMFLTWVDGVPVNEVSHAHGPGYTDLNWLIPELVDDIDFEKGPYYADRGDFANAGSANLHLDDTLERGFAKEEIGTDGYVRLLGADSVDLFRGTLLLAGEYSHYDGPWDVGDNFRKRNGVVKYSQGDVDNGFSLTFQGYRGNWLGNDQIPLSAIEDGMLPRYGTINPDTGGTSSRYSLYGDWHETDSAGTTQATVYAVHYTLNLFSDFTGFLFFPETGDEIQQNDRRWTYGGHIERDLPDNYLGKSTDDRFGFELRDDDIHTFLNDVQNNQVWAHVRADQVDETMISPWYENKIDWTDWFSTTAGIRADILAYADHSDTTVNSGNGVVWKPSPKIGVKLGPWGQTDFYAQAGLGISSEDIQGVTSKVQPGPSTPVGGGQGGGLPAQPQQALSRNRGAEVGVHSQAIPGLDTTFSLWILASENEFVFDGDVGAVTASGRPGRRWGVEWNNRWQPTGWIDVTADLAWSRAYYTDQNNPAGAQIPESIRSSADGQVTLHDLDWAPHAVFTLGWRYLGPRFLVEDASEQAKPSLVFNAKAQYDITPNLSVGAEILNLFNNHYFDADYFYQYRLPGQSPDGITGHIVHPSEPLQFRLAITEKF